MSSPSTPSPAAHLFATIAPATRTRERAAASSASGRSHRHTSPPIDSDQQRQGSASGCRSSCPPRPRPLPLCQVVRVGRSPPTHPVDPLHPAGGAVRIVPDGSRQGAGGNIPVRGAVFLANQSSQDRPHKCIALNINYLISPLGYAVQSRCSGEMILIPKI